MSVTASAVPARPLLPEIPAGVRVERVRTRADRTAFIRAPYALYKDDPRYVKPLELDRETFLDPKRNPWFDNGEAVLFLARRGTEVVGRIAAVDDRAYNAYHQSQLGFFGMFDCVNDAGVARALFDAVRGFHQERGHQALMGPVSFSTNYEWAVLVDGFDDPPAIMMPYNHRYYGALLEANGFAKAKDVFAWDLPLDPPEKQVKLAEELRRKNELVIRPANFKDFDAEVKRLREIYNAAWEKNWGFVPMSEREFTHLAKDLKQVARPELLLFAEVRGEPVGFTMNIPDANVAIKRADGKLTSFGLPIGLGKLLLGMKRIERVRYITLGVKAEHRKLGAGVVLTVDLLNNCRRLGYRSCEISWTLEDNALVTSMIEYFGGRRTKTYRCYQQPL